MAQRISTIDVRQRIGDLLNRVALRNDEFIIERKGKPLAALVAFDRLQQMQAYARAHALELMRVQSQIPMSERRATELARKAKGWARKKAKPASKRK